MADIGVRPKAQSIVLPNRQHGMVSRLQIVLVQAQHLLQLLNALRHLLRPQYQLLELFHCGSVSNVSALGLYCSDFWPCPQIASSLQEIPVQAQHLLQLLRAEAPPPAQKFRSLDSSRLQWGLHISNLALRCLLVCMMLSRCFDSNFICPQQQPDLPSSQADRLLKILIFYRSGAYSSSE